MGLQPDASLSEGGLAQSISSWLGLTLESLRGLKVEKRIQHLSLNRNVRRREHIFYWRVSLLKLRTSRRPLYGTLSSRLCAVCADENVSGMTQGQYTNIQRRNRGGFAHEKNGADASSRYNHMLTSRAVGMYDFRRKADLIIHFRVSPLRRHLVLFMKK